MLRYEDLALLGDLGFFGELEVVCCVRAKTRTTLSCWRVSGCGLWECLSLLNYNWSLGAQASGFEVRGWRLKVLLLLDFSAFGFEVLSFRFQSPRTGYANAAIDVFVSFRQVAACAYSV